MLLELEDHSTLGRLHRMVEIDAIGDADEPVPERDASRERFYPPTSDLAPALTIAPRSLPLITPAASSSSA